MSKTFKIGDWVWDGEEYGSIVNIEEDGTIDLFNGKEGWSVDPKSIMHQVSVSLPDLTITLKEPRYNNSMPNIQITDEMIRAKMEELFMSYPLFTRNIEKEKLYADAYEILATELEWKRYRETLEEMFDEDVCEMGERTMRCEL